MYVCVKVYIKLYNIFIQIFNNTDIFLKKNSKHNDNE